METSKEIPLIQRRPYPADSFRAFLSAVFATFVTFLLSIQIVVFPDSRKRRLSIEASATPLENNNNKEFTVSEMEEQKTKTPSSVLSLLQTDEMPMFSASDEEPSTSGQPPPLPSLLQTNIPLPNFLHTINEEESDDVRSISSIASPRTVVERRSRDSLNLLSPSPSELQQSSDLEEPTDVVDVPELERRDEETFDLLKELAKIGQTTKMQQDDPEIVIPEETKSEVESTNIEELGQAHQGNEEPPTKAVPETVSEEEEEEEIYAVPKVADEPMHEEPAHIAVEEVVILDDDQKLTDADRDQDEELVFNDERRKTVTMNDSHSISTTLDTTREELRFNDSVASNPIDESFLMQQQQQQSSKDEERPRSPLDLPPPPSSVVIPSNQVTENTTRTVTNTSYNSAWSPTDTTRLPSTLVGAQPLPSVLTSSNKTTNFYYKGGTSTMNVPVDTPPPPPPLPPLSSYSAVSSYPTAAPSVKSHHSSRDDLLSEHGHTSRATVREIPVQRSSSTAPSHSSVFDYRVMPSSYSTTTQHVTENPSDEYYRREVMTRTIITRSTEALSQPQLGRSSSPIERYITYNDGGRTKEERTVDYKMTVHRDIEEEERHIREDQDRRRQEEEERRAREEESRRRWELMERETLDRLRLQLEQTEKQLEKDLADRERQAKDRIEKDRTDRQRQEMIRRAEWERIEKERISLEEAELARKRALEKERLEREKAEEERRARERLRLERERLERERLEAEKREKERLERERIERERIERERIEIERIERIKRERIEKERKEKEREKEEEERLRREREELERIERERRELELREREILEKERRDAEERERQRLEDEAKEMRRREEERREAELVAEVARQAEERERARRRQERDEQERLERIRREQQRIDLERADADRRERERLEEERREKELLEASQRKKELRERERLEDIERERLRQEEERKERERRDLERRIAAERERQRREDEERENTRLSELERAAALRRAQREAELDREREREELDRKARQIAEMERKENERRERERLQEEANLAELRDKERRNHEIRDRERKEAADREANRRLEDRRSRDKLDYIAREKSEKEKFEIEKRRLIEEREALNRKKHHLLSSETLAKLTQPSYFSRVEPAEYTTKVERQVIERIDRNVWVEDSPLYPTSYQNAISYSLDSTNDDNTRDRIFNPNDINRNGSAKSRYHRAKMDKARRDFYSTTQDSTDVGSIRKSPEERTIRTEYRSSSQSKYNDSDFRSENAPYPRVGPSPYEQEFDRLLEETERKYAAYRHRMSQPSLYHVSRSQTTQDYKLPTENRAGSVVDYERQARRESPTDNSHIRSRSADYLMDRKIREETEVPENQLKKSAIESSPRESRMSEHELRFRKSTEKLTVPDWYRENRPTTATSYRPYTTTTTTTTTSNVHHPVSQSHNQTTELDLPKGMFDRYRNEIEDLRRSRSSLHQNAPDARQGSDLSLNEVGRIPGYTVSEVPNAWNHNATSRYSRVVEVADTFVGAARNEQDNLSSRYGGRITVEEILDSIFQKTTPLSSSRMGYRSQSREGLYQGNTDGPGIYTQNLTVMNEAIRQPDRAEQLLKNEDLFVRCEQCHLTRELAFAKLSFVTCKHCYTYYCSRDCRSDNWAIHSQRCSFARINTLCKDVIMKVREDEEAQAFMSKVAREGFSSSGRGSVNIRLSSPQLAQAYVNYGWKALVGIPLNQLLYYYTVQALIQERKEPSLIELCKRYEPREKFILSVSIIADIERCPETPPPETREVFSLNSPSIRNIPVYASTVPSDV